MYLFCDKILYSSNVKKQTILNIILSKNITFSDNPLQDLMLKQFTSREKKLLAYTGLFFTLLVFLWIVFAPNRGILDMLRTQKKLEKVQAENRKLKEENKALRKEIDKLQDDPAYLEEKARKDYGMLKENETLYIFKKK